jgi:hypothetical protein
MSLIRPEAQAAIWRWREVLFGLSLLLLARWWGLTAFGVLRWVAAALMLSGVLLTVAGLQRGRFRLGNAGAGVVQVVEGQLAYFGPQAGGAVALSELAMVSLDNRHRPSRWVLCQPGFDDLEIPVNATGGEALFDAFAALPEFQVDVMLQQLRYPSDGTVVIWRSAASTPQFRLED